MNTLEPELVGFDSPRLKRLDALFSGYVERGQIAGVSAQVARRGQTAYRAKYGYADIEANKPLAYDTIFRIASMTKPVTSAALMMLYEEGHFHLNTPISRFIPAFKDTPVCVGEDKAGKPILAPLEQEITFRHLFTHTAGLSYGWNEKDVVDRAYQQAEAKLRASGQPITLKMMVESLAALPLAFQPGTKWRYSMAIDVLGYLIEVISGMELDEFMRRRLFEPLGMADTDFYTPPDKAARQAAIYGWSTEANKLERRPIEPQTERPSLLWGGGGLVSTLDDYARFAQMLTNGGILNGVRLLSPTTVALFSINHAPAQALPYGFRENDLYHAGYGYSLGTRVLMDVSKTGIAGSVGEFGWDGAFSTYFWVDPKEALYGLMMLQHQPNAYYPVAQQFKQLTYQAMVG